MASVSNGQVGGVRLSPQHEALVSRAVARRPGRSGLRLHGYRAKHDWTVEISRMNEFVARRMRLDADPAVRRAVVVEDFGPLGRAISDEHCLRGLYWGVRCEPVARVRLGYVDALTTLSETCPAALTPLAFLALRDTCNVVRQRADTALSAQIPAGMALPREGLPAVDLGWAPPEEAVWDESTDTLLDMARDTDEPVVRRQAIQALGRRRVAAAVPIIATALLETPATPRSPAELAPPFAAAEDLRQTAVHALGWIGGAAAIAALRQAMEHDESPYVSRDAARIWAFLRTSSPDDLATAGDNLAAGLDVLYRRAQQVAQARAPSPWELLDGELMVTLLGRMAGDAAIPMLVGLYATVAADERPGSRGPRVGFVDQLRGIASALDMIGTEAAYQALAGLATGQPETWDGGRATASLVLEEASGASEPGTSDANG